MAIGRISRFYSNFMWMIGFGRSCPECGVRPMKKHKDGCYDKRYGDVWA